MELKAINITQKEFDSDDDFFFSCEAFIGSETMPYVYEVYDFNVISIKRLFRTFPDHGIMLNKGWLIAKKGRCRHSCGCLSEGRAGIHRCEL